VYEGWQVPLDYDPLLSKIAVWAADRTEAVARMRRALGEYEIQGIRTNIPFFRRVLEHPDFVAGHLETGFIDRVLADGLMRDEPPSEDEERVALLAALLHVERNGDAAPVPATAGNGWKLAGRRDLLNRRPQRAGGRSW
jgi:acetyl-CoA carboxylase biotin carboxylase subunit